MDDKMDDPIDRLITENENEANPALTAEIERLLAGMPAEEFEKFCELWGGVLDVEGLHQRLQDAVKKREN